jgi:hypothetical protein
VGFLSRLRKLTSESHERVERSQFASLKPGLLDFGTSCFLVPANCATIGRSHETILIESRSACWSGLSICGAGSCVKLLGEIAHLSWSETCQESIESVVDHRKVTDVCRHFALYLGGGMNGRRSLVCPQRMELELRKEEFG